MNSTPTTTSEDSIENSANQPVTWILLEFLFFIYCLMMLILIVKTHKNHLKPVHLLTLSGLVEIVTALFIYFIFDLVSLIWSETGHSFTNLDRLLAFSIWLCFYLDVMAAEVNELIFASFDHVKYHEYITNNKAMATLIVNKAITVIMVGLTSWEYPSPPTSNVICFIFFSNVVFYLSCLPFFLCFFLSLSVFIYSSLFKSHMSPA